MATNTWSTVRENVPRIRLASAYTFRLVMLPSVRINDRRPAYTHGTLTMTGWVRDSGGSSQQRVVLLKIMPAGEVIARTVSDPANAGNNYFFNGLQLLESSEYYTLEVHSLDYTTAPRIKDNRIPI